MLAGLSFAVAAVLASVLHGCGGPSPGEGDDFISGATRPESALQIGSSVLVSSMVPAGGVNKYKADGSLDDSWTPISGLANPRGLAANKLGNKLWVAHDGGVSEYTIDGSGASLVLSYDTGSLNVNLPNGLCLNGDDSLLFATQPGWKARPWGPEGVNALVKIDLSAGVITKLFEDEEGHTPNGCQVEDETIWMTNQKDGITSFDLSTSTGTTPISWSDAVRTYQSQEFAGDGIVLHQGKFYVSSWKPLPLGGMIHVCDPSLSSNQCVEFLRADACDMQLGGTESAPLLFLPSLVSGTVKTVSLPVPSPSPPAPGPSLSARGSFLVTTWSRKFVRSINAIDEGI